MSGVAGSVNIMMFRVQPERAACVCVYFKTDDKPNLMAANLDTRCLTATTTTTTWKSSKHLIQFGSSWRRVGAHVGFVLD